MLWTVVNVGKWIEGIGATVIVIVVLWAEYKLYVSCAGSPRLRAIKRVCLLFVVYPVISFISHFYSIVCFVHMQRSVFIRGAKSSSGNGADRRNHGTLVACWCNTINVIWTRRVRCRIEWCWQASKGWQQNVCNNLHQFNCRRGRFAVQTSFQIFCFSWYKLVEAFLMLVIDVYYDNKFNKRIL